MPHESFRKDLYRQPSLTQQELYPEPYRRDSSYEHLRQSPSEEDREAAATAAAATATDDDVALLRSTQQHRPRGRGSRGTMSINVHEELDQGEDCQAVLKVGLSRVRTYVLNLYIYVCCLCGFLIYLPPIGLFRRSGVAVGSRGRAAGVVVASQTQSQRAAVHQQ